MTNPKPWLEIGITEQNYKTMMSDSSTLRPANPDNDFKEELSQADLSNIKNPKYCYTENDITNILMAALDDKKVSIQPCISLQNIAIAQEKLKELTLNPEEKTKALAEIQETKEMLKDVGPSDLKEVIEREKIINLSDEERNKQINQLRRAIKSE